MRRYSFVVGAGAPCESRVRVHFGDALERTGAGRQLNRTIASDASAADEMSTERAAFGRSARRRLRNGPNGRRRPLTRPAEFAQAPPLPQ